MEIRFDGSYKSRNMKTGKMDTRFRYKVFGTQAELDQYEMIKGEYHRADENTGEPYFFTKDFVGQVCGLNFTLKGDNVYPDTSDLDIATNLIAQHEGVLGQAMATTVAQQLLANAFSRKPAPSAPVQQKQETVEAKDTDEGSLDTPF